MITSSFDVKLEVENACRLSDKKSQHNENTLEMVGVLAQIVQVELADVKMKCGELNEYGKLKEKTKKGKLERDHVPAKATLKARALKMMEGAFNLQREAKKDLNDIMESKGIKDKACADAQKKAADKIAKITDKQYEDCLDGIIKNCDH